MTFPENPVVGEEFTVHGTVFKFNGSSWDRIVIGPANRTTYTQTMITTALLTRIAHLEALIEQAFLIIE